MTGLGGGGEGEGGLPPTSDGAQGGGGELWRSCAVDHCRREPFFLPEEVYYNHSFFLYARLLCHLLLKFTVQYCSLFSKGQGREIITG